MSSTEVRLYRLLLTFASSACCVRKTEKNIPCRLYTAMYGYEIPARNTGPLSLVMLPCDPHADTATAARGGRQHDSIALLRSLQSLCSYLSGRSFVVRVEVPAIFFSFGSSVSSSSAAKRIHYRQTVGGVKRFSRSIKGSRSSIV